MALELEHTWKFEAGFRRKAVGDDPVRQLLIDYDSKRNAPFSLDLHLGSTDGFGDTHTFILCPYQSENGKGSVNLSLIIEGVGQEGVGADNVSITAFDENGLAQEWDTNGVVSVGAEATLSQNWYIRSAGVNTSNSEATVHNLKSGTYELTLTFYKNYVISGVSIPMPVFTSYQTINVFDNMTTDTWLNEAAGANANSLINPSTGVFKVTTALVNQAIQTTLYVGVPDAVPASIRNLIDVSDSNDGSPFAPLAHLSRAIDKIQAQGSSTSTYKIYVSGNRVESVTIPSGVNGKASSIEITTPSGNSQTAVLNANAAASVLKVESSVPVTISKLHITGGVGTDGKGGGINMGTGTKVTLADGAVIGNANATGIAHAEGNYSNYASLGGGIYTQGNLILKRGSKVCYNYCDDPTSCGGGGIYCDTGGSVTIQGGAEISKNGVNSSTGHGGGIYYNDGTLKMSGSAKIPDNDVWLADNKFITLTDLSNQNGTVTINSNWHRGVPVIKTETDSGLIIQNSPVENKFTYTTIAEDGWQPKFSASQITLSAPIFVGGDNESGAGTFSSPFKTISQANSLFDDPNCEYTIRIKGTTAAVQQELSGITKEANAKAITIEGYGTDAVINRQAATPATDGSALVINTDIPVTIKNLTITGGNKDGDGGGLYADVNTSVELGDGTKIKGNSASGDGGGLYVAGGTNYGIVCVNGNVEIGNKAATSTSVASTDLSTGANVAKEGAGVFCGGRFYLGKTFSQARLVAASSTPTELFISGNTATGTSSDSKHGGGGVYVAGGSNSAFNLYKFSNVNETNSFHCNYNYAEADGGGLYLADSNYISLEDDINLEIKGNKTLGNGGGIHNASTTGITLPVNTAIKSNEAVNGGGIYLYTRSGQSITVQSKAIGGSNAADANTATGCGGAVYVKYIAPNSNLVCPLVLKDDAEIPPAYDSNGSCVNTNDVYLEWNANASRLANIKVSGSTLNKGTVAAITPGNWKRGAVFLTSTGTMTQNLANKFKMSRDNVDWQKNLSSGTNPTTAYIMMPVYVASSAASDSTRKHCVAAPASGNTGTPSAPYRTILGAISEAVSSGADIVVDGKVIGEQSITSPGGNLNIRGFIDSDNGATESLASLDGNNTNGSRPLTIVADGRTITITDLKITGGRVGNAGGGGIYLSSGTLKLGDGAYVTGNSTSGNGGGVFVNSDTSLFMYGKSLIGDLGEATATSATLTESGSTGCANTAKTGGGIYNNGGSVYIGYSSTTQKSDMDAGYGVCRNYASGTTSQSGGGIMNRAGTLKIASGSVSYNKTANHGGGIYSVGTAATTRGDVTIEAPEASANNLVMFGNNAIVGGAIYVGTHCTLSMAAGQIGGSGEGEQNTATGIGAMGGAIFQGEAFSVSGTACIYPGEKTVNDVFLPKKTDTKSLVVTANSEMGNNSSLKMSLTLEEYKRGTRIVMKEGSIGSTLGSNFALTTYDNDWNKQIETTSDAGYVIINSRIFVVGTESSGSTRPDENWGYGSADGNGTRSSPYASIEDAINAGELGIAYNANTIYVAGTLKGVQSISGTDSTSLAKIPASLTINGIDSSAAIDGNSGGSALTVNASGKTITISNLKITGGSGSTMTIGGVAQSNGGGIFLNNGTVKLTDGAVISGNSVADNGGGVYLAGSGSKLFLSGKALIGDSATSTSRASSASGYHANQAVNGGGIYNNGGSVYIGSDSSGTAATGYMLVNNDTDGHYGVRRNFSTGGGCGAGIYHESGTLLIASGDISHNNAGNAQQASYSGGGIYCNANATISGGTFTDNFANHGGALYIAAGKSVTVNGASTFTGNGAHGRGGAVCNYGTFTMSAGTIGGTSSDDLNKVTISNTVTSYGGAIYQEGTFNLSGSACVYPGSVKTNDVYLAYGKTVTIAGTLNPPSGVTKVATLTPSSYSRGRNILSSTSTNATNLSNAVGKFSLSQDDTGWDRGNNISVASEATKNVWITSPIYVVDATDSGNTRPTGFNKGVTTGANGTKTSPYASVADALTCADLATVKEITIAGTLVGAQQEISDPSVDITLKGYKASGETTSAAKIQRFSTRYTTNKTNGSALKVDASGKNVTITDLTITYGAALSGAGIYITAGTVKLGDYAKINDNYAANAGGGVYVNTGATLFMYGKALIGDKLSTEAGITVAGTDGFNDYANRAQYSGGGGIYNGGAAYIGYSGFGTDGTTLIESSIDNGYGIIRNFNTNEGGGAIYNAGILKIGSGSISYNQGNTGGAIKCTADATISGGTFTANKALSGGAIYVDASKTVTIDGSATFTKNQASSSGGGAIYNAGTLTMSAGTIGEDGALNTAETSGGAIYQGGTFNISASAYVYPGSEKSNDVYLTSGKSVAVNGSWSGSQSSTSKMTLTPANWTRGTTVVSKGSSSSAVNITTDILNKFSVPDSEWSAVLYGSGTSAVGKIDADIYVAGSTAQTVSGVSYGAGKTIANGGRGTKTLPYSTVSEAVAQCWGGPNDKGTNVSRTINIVGTISGAQEIASTVTTSKASGITLKGINTNATLNGGMSSASTTKKSTLTLSTAVPVTIQSLKITGGYASGSADADRSGGGIKITAGTVTLSDNAKIYENFVASTSTSGRAKGAGLYVASGARLNISSSSAAIYSNGSDGIDGGGLYNAGTVDMTSGSIYSNRSGSEEDIIGYGGGVDNVGTFYMSGSASIYSNTSNEAGGIYNSGTLYLGRSASDASATLSGSITKNAAKAEDAGTGGGAIYNAVGGTVTMTSGTIGGSAVNKNTAVHRGGAILNYGTFNMSGGTISYNEAGYGGGVYHGVLNSSTGTVTLSGGTISDNKAIKPYGDGDDYGGVGGGVYTETGMTMSGGSIYGNTAAKDGGGVYCYDSMVMSAGTISGNKAAKNGGGVFMEGMLYMSETAVIGNSGASGYATSESACSNYAAGDGGGVYLVYDSGIVLGANAYPWSSNKKELTGGIYYNYASGSGGGIYNDSNDGMYLYTGNVCKNGAGGNGGGVCSRMKEFEMSGGTIDGNYAVNGGGVYFVGNTIDSTYFYPNLSGGTISNNAVGENGKGGGIYIGAKNSLKMSGGTISGNTATASGGIGGGVYIEDSNANLFMSKNALIGDTGTSMAFNTTGEGYSNKATHGGGIYSNGGGVYIGYKDASNTEAMTSDSYGVHHNSTTGTSGEGGGVYANGGKVKFASGGLSYNFAYKNAGGIYAKTASGNGEISDVWIYGNLAGKKGGAVYLEAGCYFNITGGTIRNNTAGRDAGASGSDGGGAVFMANSDNTTLNISGGTFTSNSVSGSARGGAIFFRAGKLNISGGAKITTSSEAKANDVYMYSKSCNLQPGQTFNGNGTTTPVAIYLGWTPTAGDAILTGSYVGSHYAKFKIIYPVGWKIANTGKAQAN